MTRMGENVKEDNLKIPDEEVKIDNYGDDTDIAWDDISGHYLDPVGVRQARSAEIDYYRKMGVCVKVPISKCFAKTGQKPIGVRWVDVNKGDGDRPSYRSRLVAKQYRQERDDDLYAATPPIESLRVVVSSWSTLSAARTCTPPARTTSTSNCARRTRSQERRSFAASW